MSASSDKPLIAAILPAAGIGARFAGEASKQPKQFIEIAGRPIWMWPLMAFVDHGQVDVIVVATLPNMIDAVKEQLAKLGSSKKILVTAGGATRQESVYMGLFALSKLPAKPDYVLVHDAARPFLTEKTISATIDAVIKHGACTVGTKVSDTIKRTDEGLITETLDRDSLVLVQTPQAGRFDWLFGAHERAKAQDIVATDDAALLEAAGHKVYVVPGTRHNIKLTEAEDLLLAETLAKTFFQTQ